MLALNAKTELCYDNEKASFGFQNFDLRDIVLEDLIHNYPTPKKNMKLNETGGQNTTQKGFIGFPDNIFVTDPVDRLLPEKEALKYPFISGRDTYFTTAFGKLPLMPFSPS